MAFLRELDADVLKSVVNDAPHALIAVDPEGYIVEENARAPGMFGYDTLKGLPVDQLVPAGKRATHHLQREQFLRNPINRPMGLGLELSGVRQDGVEFPVDISLAPCRTNKGYTWAWISGSSERTQRLDLARMQDALAEALRVEAENLGGGETGKKGDTTRMRIGMTMLITQVLILLLVVSNAIHIWSL